ncbi:hypothetical protein PG985_010981 [Apiospora marii]|uniref:Uncharacterized protein n=1 Tax=Apiospora marii TaxID=335849 RepID=A0ABR1SU72_9PEZI
MGKYGWGFRTRGPLTAVYLARGGDARTCAVAFRDPTDNVLAKLHEIMFRVALAAPNASSPRAAEFVARQQAVAIVYESRYAYLWAALGITVLAVAAVAWTASGFWTRGRAVSLSPLETANAFGAPILREKQPGASNMTIAELMKVYQDTEIQYASTVCSPGGAEDTAAGAPNKRLQMGLPGHGTGPQAQERFTG